MSIPKKLRIELSNKEFAHAYVDEFLNVSIATQIKVLREQLRLSQSDLAELAGMKQERICVLENVNYSSWSINTLRRIAKAFDVTLRVSFETFGTTLQAMDKLNRPCLQREPREEELSTDERLEAILAAANKAGYPVITVANNAELRSDVLTQATSAGSQIKQESYISKSKGTALPILIQQD